MGTHVGLVSLLPTNVYLPLIYEVLTHLINSLHSHQLNSDAH